MNDTVVAEVMAELAALEDPAMRAVNERHGDDHGVNLSKLRAIAKRLKTTPLRNWWRCSFVAPKTSPVTSWMP